MSNDQRKAVVVTLVAVVVCGMMYLSQSEVGRMYDKTWWLGYAVLAAIAGAAAFVWLGRNRDDGGK